MKCMYCNGELVEDMARHESRVGYDELTHYQNHHVCMLCGSEMVEILDNNKQTVGSISGAPGTYKQWQLDAMPFNNSVYGGIVN